MRYLSVCSGIEAASVAWHHLGWTPVAFSEIEPFPAAVLKHRFPEVPNYGDMTQHGSWPIQPGDIDLLVGGTPCQSFSVAGLRKGLEDPRGNLMLTYLAIAARLKPRWVVWENVPGVLSSNRGRDFGTFLSALGQLGYGWAYRVLDAQYVRVGRWPRAVPQRRRRVFVVGRLIERGAGDWTAAAQAVLIPEGLRRHNQASPKARKVAASDAEGGARVGFYGGSQPDCADTVTSKWSKGSGGPAGNECGLFLAQPNSWPADCAGTLAQSSTGSGAPGYSNQEIFSQNCANLVPQPVPYDLFQITAPVNRQNRKPGDPCHTLARDNAAHAAIACINMQGSKSNACVVQDGSSYSLNAMHGHDVHAVAIGTDCYNGAITGDVAATMGTPGSSVNASGTTVMQAVAFPINTMTMGGRPDPTNDSRMTMGVGADGDPQFTLSKAHNHAVAHAFYSTGGTHGVNQHPEVSPAVKVGSGLGIPSPPAVAHSLRADGFDASEDGTGRGTPLVPHAMTVRRLSPRECERLQAFPDDWTLIPWRKKPASECPDGPRYKALGNSMACNCMAWIGERIAAWEAGNK